MFCSQTLAALGENVAANTYVWSPVIAAAIPVIVVRQDKEEQSLKDCRKLDSRPRSGTTGGVEDAKQHGERSIAEILEGAHLSLQS